MRRVRHPDHSFNYAGKGEWYEPDTEEEYEALKVRFPDLEEEPTAEEKEAELLAKIEAVKTKAKPKAKPKAGPKPEIVEGEEPYESSPGWWKWDGGKHRKENLPDEAKEILAKRG